MPYGSAAVDTMLVKRSHSVRKLISPNMSTLLKTTQLQNHHSFIVSGYLCHGPAGGGLNQYSVADNNAMRGAMLFQQPLVDVSTRSE